MENELDEIAKGQDTYVHALTEFEQVFEPLLEKAYDGMEKIEPQKTGEKCPVSGVWKVDGFPTTTAPIAKGNTMPPYCGKAVTWRLIQYA